MDSKKQILFPKHQKIIEQLGENLIASAKSADGIIEIIEHIEHDFIVGFQGHIEKILDNYPLYHNVIEAFVQNAVKRSLIL